MYWIYGRSATSCLAFDGHLSFRLTYVSFVVCCCGGGGGTDFYFFLTIFWFFFYHSVLFYWIGILQFESFQSNITRYNIYLMDPYVKLFFSLLKLSQCNMSKKQNYFLTITALFFTSEYLPSFRKQSMLDTRWIGTKHSYIILYCIRETRWPHTRWLHTHAAWAKGSTQKSSWKMPSEVRSLRDLFDLFLFSCHHTELIDLM